MSKNVHRNSICNSKHNVILHRIGGMYTFITCQGIKPTQFSFEVEWHYYDTPLSQSRRYHLTSTVEASNKMKFKGAYSWAIVDVWPPRWKILAPRLVLSDQYHNLCTCGGCSCTPINDERSVAFFKMVRLLNILRDLDWWQWNSYALF